MGGTASSQTRTIVQETIGATAGVLTIVAGIPQLIKIFRENTDRLSLAFLYLLLAGALLWFLYSILLNSWRAPSESKYKGLALVVFELLTIIFIVIVIVKISYVD